ISAASMAPFFAARAASLIREVLFWVRSRQDHLGNELLVLHVDVEVEVVLQEIDERLTESFRMPASHQFMLFKRLVIVNAAGEGGHFRLASDQRGGDGLAQADNLRGGPKG